MSQTYAIVATKKLALPQPGGPDLEYARGEVVNLVVWDGETEFDPGEGMKLAPVPPGWGVVDGKLAELPPAEPDQDPPPAEPPPAPEPAPRVITALAFRKRFSPEERGALTLAASQALEGGDPALQVFLDDLSAAQEVELDHAEIRQGVDFIVAAGLISRERGDEILA